MNDDRIHGLGQDWEIVYRATTEKECRELSLVLQSADVPYQIHGDPAGLTILVSAADAPRAKSELLTYAIENRESFIDTAEHGPIKQLLSSARTGPALGVIGFIAALITVETLRHSSSISVDWFLAGRTDAELIRHGQWWRTVTALCLHVDLSHLAGNLLIGSITGWFVAQSLGPGLAWFMILLSGAAGNLLNAWVRPIGHTSVGASTAVFAAFGMLAALAWRGQWQRRTSTMKRWAPLVGGVLLLSLLGTGEGRTDIAAHVFGFFCGTLAGAALAKVPESFRRKNLAQAVFGLASILLINIAWRIAINKP